MLRLSVLAALLTGSCLVPQLAAQTAAREAVVLSQVSGLSRLYHVDLGSGKATALARFAKDDDRPLAVDVDEASGDVVVALGRGKSSTRFVRLTYVGSKLIRTHELGMVTGICSAMDRADRGELFACVQGPDGIVNSVRLGTQPNVSGKASMPVAMFSFGASSNYAWIAEEANSARPKQVRLVDLLTDQTAAGPHPWKNFKGRITGIAELVTAVPRMIVSDDQGSLSLSFNFQDPQALPITPTLPAGATEALRLDLGSYTAYVLGNQSHPYLNAAQVFGSTSSWKTLAGPLPGDPVDFDLLPPPGARASVFGHGCRGGANSVFEFYANGAPSLGNLGLRIGGRQSGHNRAPVALVIGVRELRLPLPGSCVLRVTPDIFLWGQTDALGTIEVPLPIPNDAGLAGLRVPMQFLIPDLTAMPLAFDLSSAAFLHLAP